MMIYSEALSSCSFHGKHGFYQQVNVRIIYCFTWITGRGEGAFVCRNGPSDLQINIMQWQYTVSCWAEKGFCTDLFSVNELKSKGSSTWRTWLTLCIALSSPFCLSCDPSWSFVFHDKIFGQGPSLNSFYPSYCFYPFFLSVIFFYPFCLSIIVLFVQHNVSGSLITICVWQAAAYIFTAG